MPATWHWSLRRADHRVGARADAGLAGVGLRAGVAVGAGGAVGRVRVASRCRSPGCTCPRRGTDRWPCRRPGWRRCTAPAWQVSVCVQALPSVQAVPLGAFGFEQTPVSPGCTCPATWHWSLAVQTTGLAPVQVPAWQVSVCVQALPSLHAVPLAAFGFEHDAGRRVADAGDVALIAGACRPPGCAPVQVPAWQVDVCVQALPSLHAVPFGALVNAARGVDAGVGRARVVVVAGGVRRAAEAVVEGQRAVVAR